MRSELCAGSVLALALSVVAFSAPVEAQMRVNLEPAVEKVTAPLAMAQPAGDDRLFVIEQIGLVRVVADGELLAEPFLDLRHKIVDQWPEFDEKGLLGIAFHPDYANNGKFYVAYSSPMQWKGDLAKHFWWSHTNIIEEYTVSEDDPNVADPSSVRLISAIDWPQFNHNGHWIGFGPDGMLYISTGDGGYANDWGIGHNVTEGNGQDLASPHGKMLRIDVNGTSDGKAYGIPEDNPFTDDPLALPEIWAQGLRNPWRCSLRHGRRQRAVLRRRAAEQLRGGVDRLERRQSRLAAHGGHALLRFRSSRTTTRRECDTEGLTPPILEYENCTARPENCKGISVTGGYVYRGSHQEWDGKYFFGDWSKSFAAPDGKLFVATKGSDGKWTMEDVEVANMDSLPYVLAFGQDNDGEVYVLTSVTTGPVGGLDTIYKIVPAQ